MAVRAGDDRVAGAHVGAGGEPHAIGAADGGDVADRHHDASGLRERGARDEEGAERDEPGEDEPGPGRGDGAGGIHRFPRHLKS